MTQVTLRRKVMGMDGLMKDSRGFTTPSASPGGLHGTELDECVVTGRVLQRRGAKAMSNSLGAMVGTFVEHIMNRRLS
ncbi:hypothetical protein EYF80_036273 [Liparis tanakae]|uniref:Uncharacterized protein n=1 Tax=Liparis tanakae TaxID=230148 RepID=A0A4Z2GJT4_9TELE|nr:hypothetical protein EYF80_036273 [Liparis tanakae]